MYVDAHDNTTAHELYTEFVDSISCSESAELLDFPSHNFTMMYHRNAGIPDISVRFFIFGVIFVLIQIYFGFFP